MSLFHRLATGISKHKFLVAILLLALFLRTNRLLLLFGYSHDQDLAGWFIRDVLENKSLRLIGQQTSVQGVYIGALWYYMLIPFYLLFGMSPVGGLFLSLTVGLLTVFSVWFVFRRIWSARVGLLGALVYACSFYIVMTDREVVPTTPVMLWTIWYLYSLHLLLTKKVRAGLVLTAVLFALTWHLNLALLLLLPVSTLAIILVWKRISARAVISGFFAGVVTMLPFLIFEVRNQFLQTRAIFSSLSTGGEPIDFIAKLDHTIALAARNVQALLWGSYIELPQHVPFVLGCLVVVFLLVRRRISGSWRVLFPFWIVLFILFFTLNSLNLSEYYLNGLNIVWISTLALLFDYLLSKKSLRVVGIIMIVLYVVTNIVRFFSIPVNHSAYLERSAVVAEIAQDAADHGYPCVSVSYITSPGSDLGYRYLFYMEDIHVNDAISNSPVYTIVYPHRFVDKIDKAFGAIGLIYPDYGKYSKDAVAESCSGANSNLTNPLFGFSQ